MDLSVAEIAEATGSVCPEGAQAEVRVTGVSWDSRVVAPGDLYVALPGERVDGHDFIVSAIDAGAVAVLATREIEAVVPVLVVEDVTKAFTDLAAYWRTCLTGTVIGLTGSTGKTTTKNLVRDVLMHDMSVVATKANQNNELGVPRTLLAADRHTQAVVVEMGMRGRGQITELTEIAQPAWGLITNVGTSHIELLGSREEIARAKAELFEALPESYGIAFVNACDEYALDVCNFARLEERGVQVVLFAGDASVASHTLKQLQATDEDEESLSDPLSLPLVWASDVVVDSEGRASFTMNAVGFEQLQLPDANGSHQCNLQLLGIHNVSNACSAAAVGLASGMTMEACCEALEAAQPERGRQQVHHTPDGIMVIDDAYNANLDSMTASLQTFASMKVQGRRFAVLGDMLELGEYTRESHEQVGTVAAKVHIDKLVCVGELSHLIAEAAREAGMDPACITLCSNAEEAADVVQPQLEPGDAVLVKASHSIGLQRVVERLVV